VREQRGTSLTDYLRVETVGGAVLLAAAEHVGVQLFATYVRPLGSMSVS